MNVFTNNTALLANNSWNGITGTTDYSTSYTYDKNGNLQTLSRKAYTVGGNNTMDSFTYNYGTVDSQNKLNSVYDSGDGIDYGDIRSNQVAVNYTYNNIGQLINDEQEKIIDIQWTVSGKVKSIERDDFEGYNDVSFFYDAMGNRIGKLVKPRGSSGDLKGELDWVYTHYVLDASGNTMAVYEETYEEWENSLGIDDGYTSITKLREHPIYGSSRLGIQNIDKVVSVVHFEKEYSFSFF